MGLKYHFCTFWHSSEKKVYREKQRRVYAVREHMENLGENKKNAHAGKGKSGKFNFQLIRGA